MLLSAEERASSALPAPNDRATPPDFDSLVQDYAKFRSGYSAELFARILRHAPAQHGLHVLDLASGTGLSAQGLQPAASRLVAVDIAPHMLRASPVKDRVLGKAEALPFRAASFDLVACAQAFHWMEPLPALREMHRVLRPGGLAALWWKYEDARDPIAQLTEAVLTKALGAPAPHTALARDHGELPGVAESPFGRMDEAWIPDRVRFTAPTYVGYQASRENLRRAAGPRRDAVLAALDHALRERVGERAFEVAYASRLCLLRKD